MPNVCVGCGLDVQADGKLIVDTVGAVGVRPRHVLYNTVFPCAANTEFPPIFCAPDGLRAGAPEHTSIMGISSRQDNFVPDEILPFNSPVLSRTIVNPSDCRAMNVWVQFASIATVTIGPTAVINFFHNIDIGSGFSPTSAWQQHNEGNTTRVYTPGRPITILNLTLPPGGSQLVRFNTIADHGAIFHANDRFNSVATEIRFFGMTS